MLLVIVVVHETEWHSDADEDRVFVYEVAKFIHETGIEFVDNLIE